MTTEQDPLKSQDEACEWLDDFMDTVRDLNLVHDNGWVKNIPKDIQDAIDAAVEKVAKEIDPK